MVRCPARRSLLRACAGLALARLCAAAFASDDLYVISNAQLALSPEEIKEVFLGEVQFAGSTRLVPIDNGAAQAAFLERVLRMRPDRYAAWWTKKAFRDGVNPPPVRASDAQVMAFVKDTPGAIGYVGTPPMGVFVIGRF